MAGGRDYAGKPRPVVIVQDYNFDATASITICAFTTDEKTTTVPPPCRTERAEWTARHFYMVNKIITVQIKVGAALDVYDPDILRLNQALRFSSACRVATTSRRAMR